LFWTPLTFMERGLRALVIAAVDGHSAAALLILRGLASPGLQRTAIGVSLEIWVPLDTSL
jgi:hypothetical protein